MIFPEWSLANTYYCSPSGNDTNAGTFTAPWFTLQRAWTSVAAGDTIYMRGGTYTYTVQPYLTGKSGSAGNLIKIWAYPGESPVITRGTTFNKSNGWHRGMVFLTGNYIHIRGIRFTGMYTDDNQVDAGLQTYNVNNCVFELLECDNNVEGMIVENNSNNNLILNCDFHDNYSNYNGSNGGNSDGLGITYMSSLTSINIIKGCRTWNNGDDGFDTFENSGYVLFDSCWAWHNGYIYGTDNEAGDGMGFKLGSDFTTTPANIGVIKRRIQRCIAFDNSNTGVHINEADFSTQIYNNVFVSNKINGINFDYNDRVHYIRNNISFNNPQDHYDTNAVVQNNSWQNGLSVSTADFLSVDSLQLNAPRLSSGQLPLINYLHLAAGSPLIDTGLNVGLVYSGAAPDLGAFETSGTTPPVNLSPVAQAGADQTITLPENKIALNGSASTDPDGMIDLYQWRKAEGPVFGTIHHPFQAIDSITGLAAGTYLIELTVVDNAGASVKDTMQIVVNAVPSNLPPQAEAGNDQVITLPINQITLNGTASSDPDGTIVSFNWNKISGPEQDTITNPSLAITLVKGLKAGVYLFELNIMDNNSSTDKDTLQVIVFPPLNIPPTANAGPDQWINLPTNSVTLNGTGSSDQDGTITSYTWAKVSGPASGNINTPGQSTTIVTDLAVGMYFFELTITDDSSSTVKDTVVVSVNPPNQLPIANAGTDQAITLPTDSVTLDGTGSSDPDGIIIAYAWRKIGGPANGTISSPSSASTSITGLAAGVYSFELMVTDDNNDSQKDTVRVTVNPALNLPPTSLAGPDQVIILPTNSTTLDGTASTDPDGTITAYSWIKIEGPLAGTITSPAGVATSVTGMTAGVYSFELTVTDDSSAVDKDTVMITVHPPLNTPPVASAGADQSITLPVNSATLNGTASTDPDGTITAYSWIKIEGPLAGTITSPAGVATSVTGMTAGVYSFELTVTDDSSAVDKDTVMITVYPPLNTPPVASAGADQSITLPVNTATLNGTASTDPDGTITVYSWNKIAGPDAGTIISPSTATTTVTGLTTGVYSFELTVTDDSSAVDKDTVLITVHPPLNTPPVASAGTDQSITLPVNSVTLNGTGSSDPDGTITVYSWIKIAGPVAGTIISPSTATTTVTGLTTGVYSFELTVTDDSSAVDKDTVLITVHPPLNTPPVASAGTDQSITLPINSVTLNGTGSTDPDGTITSYAWSKIAGPVAGTLNNPSSATTTVTGMTAGVYSFELTVTDDSSAVDKDTVLITVHPPLNTPPVASAGTDQSITLPINSVTLNGTGSTDPDGTITSYAWSKIAGPVAGTLTNPSSATTTVTGMTAGVYSFELTVTDDSSAVDKDTVVTTVYPPLNTPPVASAGTDQSITLPVNSATLNGTGSTDPDGTIVSYLWTKIAGPLAGTITNPASATTTVTGLITGVYSFELTVTDDSSAIDKDTVQITVYPPLNTLPVASAGADQSITLPVNSATLNGTASTDPDGTIINYAWTKIAGPVAGTLTNPAGVATSVTGMTAGVYSFELTVTDDSSAVDKDTVVITVHPPLNIPPSASAGADQSIRIPVNMVTLDGTGSSDPDGTITNYAWTKIAGPVAGTLTNPSSATTTVTGMTAGVYSFELTVTDDSSAVDKDTVVITVYPPLNIIPVANAGADQSITLPVNSITLNGTASTDPDGTIASYLWTKIAGPLAGTIINPAGTSTSVTGLTAGVYSFELTVTDDSSAVDKDTVVITVYPPLNIIPVANAGADQSITLPVNSITLNGTASTDPDGTIASYLWTKIAGPLAGTIINPAGTSTSVTGLTAGVYSFELTVTDDSSAVDKDTVVITVYPPLNIIPVANAGADQSITLPVNSITLNGTASTDPDGTIVSYAWIKITGPVAGTITSPSTATTTVIGLTAGVYSFELTVTDDSSAVDKDTILITVHPPLNTPPVASAGTDQSITLPVNSATLNGTGSTDPDGTIVSYAWIKITGPVAGTITSPSTATTTVIGLTAGVYSFELTVTDDSSAIDKDTVVITVYPPLNIPPSASAGSDQSITLPVNSVTLNGTASTDPDGTIVSYLWTKITGPVAGTITSPSTATTTVIGLTAGVYSFELTVTDDSSAIDKDTVVITVYPPLNIPPSASAGTDQSITLPVNSVTLNGTASTDPDGTIVSYLWTKIAGPVAGTITNPASATTTVTGMTAGIYSFELTVTDDSSAVDRDTVIINVHPPLNTPPVASAGADQSIRLPVNMVTLDGTGSSDPDGTISAYSWIKIAGPVAGTITNPAGVATSVTGMTAGVYSFELTVTDDSSAVDKDTVVITVHPPLNIPPSASAGADQSIRIPVNMVTLDGTGSSDPDGTISSYFWTKIAGPVTGTISSPSAASTSVNGLTAGVYSFELTVTDDSSAVDKDTVVITVYPPLNTPPVASAGPYQSITLPVNSVTLNGTASTDPDGTITSYAWSKIAGPLAGAITNPAAVTTSVTGLTAGVYSFELTVTDDSSAVDKDTVVITVYPPLNTPPVASAGPDQSITLPVNSVTLNGTTSTDPDGTITSYAWSKIAGPLAGAITNPAAATTSVTGLTAGVYSFELTVTDDSSAVDKDTVVITVYPPLNIPPSANAGADQSITLPVNSVSLNGTGSIDPDGTIINYAWTKIAGPLAGAITNPAAATTSVTGLTAGVYSFELTVTDDSSAIDKDTVVITVYPPLNIPPSASAGTDQSITLPVNSITLNGTGSTDPDGTITSYAWSKIAGPVAGTITNPSSATTTVTGLITGVYSFELTVTDDSSAVDKDTVVITVYPPLNIIPVANAGADQSIRIPVNMVPLDGTGSSDPDGTITAYSWIKIAGPVAGTLTNPSSATTTVTGMTPGVYSFELTVTDDSSAVDKDTVVITVYPPLNIPPSASAGADQSITLPVNSVTLNGTTSTDPDGTITSYAWSKIAGPLAGAITNPAAATTSVTGLTAGVYSFELTVTDDSSAIDRDTIIITVHPPLNTPPVASAGPDQSITLPVNSVTINGTASTDPDGTITSYAWSKIAGPLAGAITNPAAATTSVTGLTAGVYSFELTVTDDSSAVDRDTVIITVQPAPNVLPVAVAGNDLSMTLPANSCILNGSASYDSDGTITSYLWSKIAGPSTGTILNPAQAISAVSGLTEGIYKFELIVTDNNQGTSRDTIVVTVHAVPNLPPVARAGVDLVITLPVNNITLDGRNSTDPDGTIINWAWAKISGPAGAVILNSTASSTTTTFFNQGVYLFELTVTDNNAATGKDTVQVTVQAAPNRPPDVIAGPDIVIYLPLDSVTLSGSATDPDGVISSVQWRKIDGPASFNLSNPAAAVTAVKKLNAGIYHFELSAADNQGLIARDTMMVEVKPAEKRMIRVYPNPVTSVLILEINATTINSLTRIIITNSQGVVVYRETVKRDQPSFKQTLDLSGLAAGYYLMEINEDGRRMDMLKIIVQH